MLDYCKHHNKILLQHSWLSASSATHDWILLQHSFCFFSHSFNFLYREFVLLCHTLCPRSVSIINFLINSNHFCGLYCNAVRSTSMSLWVQMSFQAWQSNVLKQKQLLEVIGTKSSLWNPYWCSARKLSFMKSVGNAIQSQKVNPRPSNATTFLATPRKCSPWRILTNPQSRSLKENHLKYERVAKCRG